MAGIKGNLNFENTDNVEFLLSTEGDVNSQRFIDISKNRFSITTNGNTKITDVDVNYGYSVYFDGIGDYLSFPASSEMSMGTSDYTIEFWIYLLGSSDFTVIDNQGSGGNMQISRITGAFYHGSANTWNYTFSNSIWTHVVFCREGSNLRLFINGLLQQTQTNSNVIGSATGINNIGRRNDNFYPLNGYVSNLRVVKGTAVYTSNFTPPTGRLSAIPGTSLLTCQDIVVKDNSINNFTITKNDNARESLFGVRTVKKSVAYFDGSGDYLSVPSNVSFQLGTGDFTIESFINLQSFIGTPVILDMRTTNGTTGGALQLSVTTAGLFQVYGGSSTSTLLGRTSALVTNVWYHIAVTRQSNIVYIFLNGIQTNSISDSTNYALQTLWIGSLAGGGNNYVQGYISNLRIVKGIAIYTGNFIPPTESLTAISGTSLLTCQDNTIVDNSLNNFLITKTGDVTPSNFNPFNGYYYSVYFDGSGDYLSILNDTKFSPGIGNFSFETFINFSQLPANNTIYPFFQNQSNPVASATNDKFWIGLQNVSGSYQLTLGRHSTSTAAYTTWTPDINHWYHIAIVRNSGVVYMYINGISQTITGNTNFNGVNLSQDGICIGAISTPYYFNGYISNLRYLIGSTLYSNNFVPPKYPLTVIENTVSLMCQNSTFVDNSENKITVYGDASISNLNPFNVNTNNYSFYYDGVGDNLILPASSDFNFGTGDFTIECWFHCANHLGNMFSLRNFATNGITFRVYQGKISVFYGNGVGVINVVTGYISNQWNHAVLQRKNGIATVYQNGVNVGFQSWAGVNINQNPTGAEIGRYGNYAENFRGYISNLRIVKGVALYSDDANFTPPLIFNKPINYITYKKDKNLSNVEFLIKASSAPTNTSFVESSYNNLTVTNNSSVTVSSTQSKFNSKSINFSGSNYLSIAANSRFLLGTNNFTIECWFYVTTLATAQSLITSHQIGGMFAIAINTSGRPYVSINVSGGSSTSYASLICTSSQVVINTWYHLAVVRKTTSLDIFLNGIKDQTSYNIGTSVVGSYGGNKPIYIGAGADTTTKMTGYIDNVRYTVGVARYSENFLVPTEDFTGVR